MAYDEELAIRLRSLLKQEPGLTEQRMFGGLSFMVHGNMACGIVKNDLMLRVGEERFTAALAKPHARPMDFTKRPMVGMVYVDSGGYAHDEDLRQWVGMALDFVRGLPPKAPGAARKRK